MKILPNLTYHCPYSVFSVINYDYEHWFMAIFETVNVRYMRCFDSGLWSVASFTRFPVPLVRFLHKAPGRESWLGHPLGSYAY